MTFPEVFQTFFYVLLFYILENILMVVSFENFCGSVFLKKASAKCASPTSEIF